MTKIISLTIMNLPTPKVGTNHGLLFNLRYQDETWGGFKLRGCVQSFRSAKLYSRPRLIEGYLVYFCQGILTEGEEGSVLLTSTINFACFA